MLVAVIALAGGGRTEACGEEQQGADGGGDGSGAVPDRVGQRVNIPSTASSPKEPNNIQSKFAHSSFMRKGRMTGSMSDPEPGDVSGRESSGHDSAEETSPDSPGRRKPSSALRTAISARKSSEAADGVVEPGDSQMIPESGPVGSSERPRGIIRVPLHVGTLSVGSEAQAPGDSRIDGFMAGIHAQMEALKAKYGQVAHKQDGSAPDVTDEIHVPESGSFGAYDGRHLCKTDTVGQFPLIDCRRLQEKLWRNAATNCARQIQVPTRAIMSARKYRLRRRCGQSDRQEEQGMHEDNRVPVDSIMHTRLHRITLRVCFCVPGTRIAPE